MVSLQPRFLGLWIDRVVAIFLVLNLAWTTWHLGGVLAKPMAVSFAVLMVTLAIVVVRWTMVEPTGCPRGWWWPLPMLVYAGVHLKWVAIAPGRAWLDGLHWGWMAAAWMIGLHVMRVKSARQIVWGGGAAITLGLVLLASYQRLGHAEWLPTGRFQVETFWTRSGGAFGVPNSLAAWMILVLPVAGALAWPRSGQSRATQLVASLVWFGGSLALLLTYSRGGWIALSGAVLIWPLIGSASSWKDRWRKLGVVALLVSLVAGLTYLAVAPARERIDQMVEQSGELTRPILWKVGWQSWRDAPWLGWGGGSYEVVFERYRPFGFWDEPRWTHNDYLNTLSDYGIVGFLLSFGLSAGAVWATVRRRKVGKSTVKPTNEITVALAVGLIAVGLGTVVDFHLKIPAIALLVALGLADWFTQTWRSKREPSRSWGTRLGLGWAIGLIGFGTVVAVPKFQSEGARFYAREKIDNAAEIDDPVELQAVVEPTLVMFEEAVRLFPAHEQAWSDLAYARALRVNWEPEMAWEYGVEAEVAARRALALCDENWESWVRLGTALDLQDRWSEAGLAFGKSVKLASNSAEAWYYQAFHLSLKPMGMPVAKTALATCLRLDPWNPDGKALLASFQLDRP